MTEENKTLARLRALIADYLDTVSDLEAKRKPADGLLGLKGGPADDPCHDRFAQAVEALMKESAAASPSSGEAAETLSYLFEAAAEQKDSKSAYWMLIAVQGFGLELIDRLSAADAKALRERYADLYPRWERLPVQDKLLKKLKSQSK